MQAFPFPVRKECPPGACDCRRELLLEEGSDIRILRLTREEEKKLVARLENAVSYADLLHVGELMRKQLGIVLTIAPGSEEVRTVRGFEIRLAEQPGLCRKTRQAIPAAIRRCLENKPEIAWEILDADGLFGQR